MKYNFRGRPAVKEIKTQKGNFSVFLLLNTEKSYSHLLHTENMYFLEYSTTFLYQFLI